MSEKDNFEKGIFWELYKDLERQFENFLEYVPYLEENENMCSFKLLNLILSIGGHVDSAFKEMARYPDFSGNNDCKEILKRIRKKETVSITLPLKAFETEYKLSEKTVTFKRVPEREKVMPFKPRSSRAKAPKWWKVYNDVKHDVSVNIKGANLQTTLHALAGAFLLNVIHFPAAHRLHEYGALKGQYFVNPFAVSESVETIAKSLSGEPFLSREAFQAVLEGKISYPIYVETSLFKYEYNQ